MEPENAMSTHEIARLRASNEAKDARIAELQERQSVILRTNQALTVAVNKQSERKRWYGYYMAIWDVVAERKADLAALREALKVCPWPPYTEGSIFRPLCAVCKRLPHNKPNCPVAALESIRDGLKEGK